MSIWMKYCIILQIQIPDMMQIVAHVSYITKFRCYLGNHLSWQAFVIFIFSWNKMGYYLKIGQPLLRFIIHNHPSNLVLYITCPVFRLHKSSRFYDKNKVRHVIPLSYTSESCSIWIWYHERLNFCNPWVYFEGILSSLI